MIKKERKNSQTKKEIPKGEFYSAVAYNLSIFAFLGAIGLPILFLFNFALPFIHFPSTINDLFYILHLSGLITSLMTVWAYRKSNRDLRAKAGLNISLLSIVIIVIVLGIIRMKLPI